MVAPICGLAQGNTPISNQDVVRSDWENTLCDPVVPPPGCSVALTEQRMAGVTRQLAEPFQGVRIFVCNRLFGRKPVIREHGNLTRDH